MQITSQFILFMSESRYQKITFNVARGITFSEMIKDPITGVKYNYSKYKIVRLSHLETWKNNTQYQGVLNSGEP